MPRRGLPPIVSIKHYHHQANTQVASGGILRIDPVAAIANTSLPTVTNEVMEGAIIKAVYVEMWVKGEGASDADTQFNLAIYKNPGGTNNMLIADIINLMAYDNKKNVLFASQGVIGGIGGGQAVPVIRQWVKIPNGKQRFGLKDKFTVALASTGQTMQVCGLMVYKEYR